MNMYEISPISKTHDFFTLIIVDWQVQYLQLLCFNDTVQEK